MKARMLVRRIGPAMLMALQLAMADPAHAIDLDLGINRLSTSLVTDVRYAVGTRVEGRDAAVANNPFFASADYKFNSGDIVTDRLDLTPQFVVKYSPEEWGWLTDIGLRASGNLFKDFAYTSTQVACRPGTTSVGLPQGLLGTNSGPIPLPGQGVSYCDPRVTGYSDTDGQFSATTKYRNVRNAELQDAFAFANLDIGDTAVSLRAGNHALFWGEALFNPYMGVSYSQGPVDLNKALTVPGINAQDLFIPVNQLSGTISPSENVTLGFQYYLPWSGWRRLRAPEGGTYMNPFDGFLNGPDSLYLATLPLVGPYDVKRYPDVYGTNHHDFGIQTKVTFDFPIEATYGFYYRQFDEVLPWINTVAANSQNEPLLINGLGQVLSLLDKLGIQLTTIPTLPGGYLVRYPRNTRLYGFSLSTKQMDVSFGMDLAYSPNHALNSQWFYTANGDDGQRARGETLSGVFNALYLNAGPELFGRKLWDTGTYVVELNWSYLLDITQNQQFYKGVGTAACRDDAAILGATHVNGDTVDECSSRYSIGIAAVFQPAWYQVLPGIDMRATAVVQDGVKNDSAMNLTSFQGALIGQAGFDATFFNQVNAAVAYNFYGMENRTGTNLAGESTVTSFNFLGTVKDRDFVSITLKYSF